MFEATSQKIRDVSFQKIDVDQDKSTGAKYGVQGIPYLVFLDANENVLFTGHSFPDEESFAQAINRFR